MAEYNLHVCESKSSRSFEEMLNSVGLNEKKSDRVAQTSASGNCCWMALCDMKHVASLTVGKFVHGI